MARLNQTVNKEQDRKAARALAFVFCLHRLGASWHPVSSLPEYQISQEHRPIALAPSISLLSHGRFQNNVSSCVTRIWPGNSSLGCRCFLR